MLMLHLLVCGKLFSCRQHKTRCCVFLFSCPAALFWGPEAQKKSSVVNCQGNVSSCVHQLSEIVDPRISVPKIPLGDLLATKISLRKGFLASSQIGFFTVTSGK